ncbi:MAG: hypothetical protein JWO19_5281 [Bryobacterales bacterium]|nr:hypothetical protein [Bryobacterales bacterium]
MPAWAVVVLAISSYYGNLKRIGDGMKYAWDSLTNNPHGLGALLTLLASWIVLSMYWPRPKLAVYKFFGHEPKPRPKPMGSRMAEAETQLEILQRQIKVTSLVSATTEGVASALSKTVEAMQADFSMRCANLFGDLSEQKARIDEHRSWIASIEPKVNGFPEAIMNFLILRELQNEAHSLGREMSRLRELHGPLIVPTEAAWNKWAHDLAFHIVCCQGLAIQLGTTYFDGDLFILGGKWHENDWTMKADSRILEAQFEAHVKRLAGIRQNYAARLKSDGNARVVIS